MGSPASFSGCSFFHLKAAHEHQHAGAADNEDELTLTPAGRYLTVVLYRQYLAGLNNLREQARSKLTGNEHDLLFRRRHREVARPLTPQTQERLPAGSLSCWRLLLFGRGPVLLPAFVEHAGQLRYDLKVHERQQLAQLFWANEDCLRHGAE